MRYFFRRRIPPFRHVLLVESGSRYLFEGLLPGLYSHHPDNVRVDLVTCYPGLPKGFDAGRGDVYRVPEIRGRAARKAFYRRLREVGYDVMGIICSGEPIMTKWKWVLAARLPAKLFVLNENGDYFWADYSQTGTIKHFALYRAGLAGSEGVTTLLRLALFPFTFTYLLLYAAYVHLRRMART